MTQQIIERWSKLRNLSIPDAMLELRFLGDILASNKKNSEYTESKEMITDTINIPQTEQYAYANEAKMDSTAY